MHPRAARTRASLENAILSLAAEKPIDEIPVTELVARAGVNRSSFYQHFTDIEELLASALETVETRDIRVTAAVTIGNPSQPPPELVRFLEHFAHHAAVYRQAFGAHGSARVLARVRTRTLQLVREGIELSSGARRTEMPLDVEAAGTAGMLLGVIEAWLARDPLLPVDDAAGWVWEILNPSDRALR